MGQSQSITFKCELHSSKTSEITKDTLTIKTPSTIGDFMVKVLQYLGASRIASEIDFLIDGKSLFDEDLTYSFDTLNVTTDSILVVKPYKEMGDDSCLTRVKNIQKFYLFLSIYLNMHPEYAVINSIVRSAYNSAKGRAI